MRHSDVSYINFYAITNSSGSSISANSDVSYIKFHAITNMSFHVVGHVTDVSYIKFHAITNSNCSSFNTTMMFLIRNHYDIVTEGIISTIPLIFSSAKVLQIAESSKFSQTSFKF